MGMPLLCPREFNSFRIDCNLWCPVQFIHHCFAPLYFTDIMHHYLPPSQQACTPFSPYNVMYAGWVGDDDSSFLGLRACAHKVRCMNDHGWCSAVVAACAGAVSGQCLR